MINLLETQAQINYNPFVDPIVSSSGASWMVGTNIYGILLRIGLAFLFAAIIGIERSIKRHSAGLRTYILVCVASALVMMTNEYLTLSFNNGDTARLGAQVVTGVGFLGAGTILVTSRNQVKGLTTAAGLWGCACLGLVIGAGFYTAAIVGFVVMVFTIFSMPRFEKFFTRKAGAIEFHVEFEERANLKEFVSYVREKGLDVQQVEHNPAYANSGLSVYTIMVVDKEHRFNLDHNKLIGEIKELPYVNYVEEI